MTAPRKTRRRFLRTLAAAGLGCWLCPLVRPAGASAPARTRTIPSTGEAVPVVGMGTWITFNVGDDPVLREERAQVMAHFFGQGGTLIDSSPMYGSSQDVVGYGLETLGKAQRVFSADKVWTPLWTDGREQVEASRRLWGVRRFDLMQVHNLVDMKDHLPMLFEMKQEGSVRYVGITTSEGRRHDEVEWVMRHHPVDFIQVSYNIRNRRADERLLPLAQDRGIAVIANRPFQQKALIDWAQRHPLPEWAAEVDCANWAQFLLKYIVSHPAVTCVIPATTRVDHVLENMGAAAGRLPDPAMRRRMAAYCEAL